MYRMDTQYSCMLTMTVMKCKMAIIDDFEKQKEWNLR